MNAGTQRAAAGHRPGSRQAELDRLLVREKAHTREGDAIAAGRRRLPMVEVDATTPVTGEHGQFRCSTHSRADGNCSPTTAWARRQARRGPVRGMHVFNGRSSSCRTCTHATSPSRVLRGPVPGEQRVSGFMGWEMPCTRCEIRWPAGRRTPVRHDVLLPASRRASLRDVLDKRPRVRGDGPELRAAGHDRLRPPGDLGRLAGGLAPALATSGEQFRLDGRPIAQWARMAAGRSDDLGTAGARA